MLHVVERVVADVVALEDGPLERLPVLRAAEALAQADAVDQESGLGRRSCCKAGASMIRVHTDCLSDR